MSSRSAAATVYADSATGTGNGATSCPPDDVREMHKYYYGLHRVATADADTAAAADDHIVQQVGASTVASASDVDPLPPELRHDDYSPVSTGNSRLPPKLMPYGLPVCAGDSAAAAKLLTNAAGVVPPPAANYYPTTGSATAGVYGDYVHAYGPYGGSGQDMASVMAGYHHSATPGYPCQRMTPASSPAAAAQFNDVKPGLLPHGNSAELYQWVREQQNFAANTIGITARYITIVLISSLVSYNSNKHNN